MNSSLQSFDHTHYARLESPDVSREARIDFVVRHIEKCTFGKQMRLLELGCGSGVNLLQVSQRLPEFRFALFGTDIAEEAVQASRTRGVGAFRVDLNVGDIPLPDRSVDAVLFLEVIEHLYDSDRPMREIVRLLDHNGLLFLSTPNLASWANRLAVLLGYQPFSHDVSFLGAFGQPPGAAINGHIKSFTRRALLEYVRFFGFDVIDEGTTPAGGVSGLVSLIDRAFSSFPTLASHTLLMCRKRTDGKPPAGET